MNYFIVLHLLPVSFCIRMFPDPPCLLSLLSFHLAANHGGQADAKVDDQQNGDAIDVLVEFLERCPHYTLVPVDLVSPLVQAVDDLFCWV
jgi:hypothetical protein